MANADYLKDMLKKLPMVDFLQTVLNIMIGDFKVKTEEELLLLDKILYQGSNISKDYKMELLTPQLKEKFLQRMKEIKLDQLNFTNNLKQYEKGKGPYTKSKADIPLSLPPALENAVPKPVAVLPEKTPVVTGPEKRQAAYASNARRTVEKGGMTPKRRRSSSSSGSESDEKDESDKNLERIRALEKEIARLSGTQKGLDNQQQKETNPTTPRPPPAKLQFALKKPDPAGRNVLMHATNDAYFERSSVSKWEPRPELREPRGEPRSELREPRSERGEQRPELREPRSEREYRNNDPDVYSPLRADNRKQVNYRSKTYRPSFHPHQR